MLSIVLDFYRGEEEDRGGVEEYREENREENREEPSSFGIEDRGCWKKRDTRKEGLNRETEDRMKRGSSLAR